MVISDGKQHRKCGASGGCVGRDGEKEGRKKKRRRMNEKRKELGLRHNVIIF